MGKRKAATLILLLLLVAFPAVTQDPYILNILITTGIWTTSVWGVRVIMSTGQLTLGHAAYMAVGAYASTLLTMKAGLSFWLAFPLAGLISSLVALLIGYPTLRIKGVYFAIITFAFAEIVRAERNRALRGCALGPWTLWRVSTPDMHLRINNQHACSLKL